jgi:hypothetical protein
VADVLLAFTLLIDLDQTFAGDAEGAADVSHAGGKKLFFEILQFFLYVFPVFGFRQRLMGLGN